MMLAGKGPAPFTAALDLAPTKNRLAGSNAAANGFRVYTGHDLP